MATHQGDENLKVPAVTQFKPQTGAAKDSTKNDPSVVDGSMFAPGPMRSNGSTSSRPRGSNGPFAEGTGSKTSLKATMDEVAQGTQ